jgi:hypothetical protein
MDLHLEAASIIKKSKMTSKIISNDPNERDLNLVELFVNICSICNLTKLIYIMLKSCNIHRVCGSKPFA